MSLNYQKMGDQRVRWNRINAFKMKENYWAKYKLESLFLNLKFSMNAEGGDLSSHQNQTFYMWICIEMPTEKERSMRDKL